MDHRQEVYLRNFEVVVVSGVLEHQYMPHKAHGGLAYVASLPDHISLFTCRRA